MIIVGYSGHSYVCIEIAQKINIKVKGYCDLNKKKHNPFNLSYLGHENDINNTKDKMFIAVGDNFLRKKIISNLDYNVLNINLIHPKSVISNTSILNHQILINAGVIVNSLVKIGTGCIINTGAIIEHNCEIENFVHIAPGAVICGGVNISEGTFIGANSIVNQGVSIGKNVIIGSGSVVLNDIPDNSKVAGNPIKNI